MSLKVLDGTTLGNWNTDADELLDRQCMTKQSCRIINDYIMNQLNEEFLK